MSDQPILELDQLTRELHASRVGCNRGPRLGRRRESFDVLRLEPPLQTLADPLDNGRGVP